MMLCDLPSGFSQQPSFRSISHKEGLPQRSVLSVYQDSFDFMWFGTRDGLTRYDGYEFIVFRHQLDDSTSIAGNTIFSISGDKNGNIWTATDKGLSRYNIDNNTFSNFFLPPELYESSSIHEVFVSRSGTVWVGCRYGLFEVDTTSGEFQKHSFLEGNELMLSHGVVSAITEDRKGQLWVGTSNLGLFQYNPLTKQGRSVSHKNDQSAYPSRIESLVIDGVNVYAGTYGSGLFLFNTAGDILRRWHVAAPKVGDRISSNHIRDLVLDKLKNLWIGTFEGLYWLSYNGSTRKIALYDYSSGTHLQPESIRALYRDRADNIWVGTYADGIKLYARANSRFELYKAGLESSQRITTSRRVSALHWSKETGIIVGTEAGTLYDTEGKKNVISALPSDDAIKAIYDDRKGNLWLGSFGKGLYRYDKNKKSFKHFPLSIASEEDKNKRVIINSIMGDETGLWIGTDGHGGLHYFSYEQQIYETYKGQKSLQSLINHQSVKHILPGNKDEILLATHGHGLVIYDRKTGLVEKKTHFEVEGSDLLIEQINHIMQDSEGGMWLSTQGQGVIVFQPGNKDKNKHYHINKGLLDNVVYGAVVDKLGKIWFVSLHGITSLDTDGKLDRYGYDQGVPLQEVNEGAFAMINTDSLLLGGTEGWIKFDLLAENIPKTQAAMHFTALHIGNKRVQPDDASGILHQSILKTDYIQLNHKQTHLTLEFSDLDFHHSKEHAYEYRLEGVNEEWVRITNNSVTFTNLKAGEYVFRVRPAGVNIDEQEAVMKIDVMSPPWFSWWAKTLYLLLVVSLIIYFWRRYLQSIRLKHRLRLEQLKKEKWKEIHDVKLSYFLDVSHEFKTPLSLILAPLEELMTSENLSPWKKNRLDIMHFNTQRLRLLSDQILQIRELDTGQYTVAKQPVRLRYHLEDILMSFWPLAEKQKIQLIVDVEQVGDSVLMLDRDKLEKILFNLIQNAFKFTPPGGEVGLRAKFISDTLTFVIWDTGVGIKNQDLLKIFERFYTKGNPGYGVGIGLSLCKSLIDVMQGTIAVESKVMEGTRFLITIPNVERSEALPEESQEEMSFKGMILEDPKTTLVRTDTINHDKSKKSILLVDDNQEIINYLAAQLQSEYEIYLANDGKKGLKMTHQYVPDLIISDLVMPELDGYGFCKEVKSSASLCHIPFMLLTAKNAYANKMEGLTVGADVYLAKPFHVSELKLRIKNIMRAKELIYDQFRTASYIPEISVLTQSDHDKKLLNKINETIVKNLDNPDLNVEWLGNLIGLSRVHLFRKIKSLTGLTPSDYIKNYRIKYACELLVHGNVRISDVAFRVGFQDTHYFAKVFKKEIGKSPSDFIKSSE